MLYTIPKKYRKREEVFGIIKHTDSESVFQYSGISFLMKCLKRKQDSPQSCFLYEEPMLIAN